MIVADNYLEISTISCALQKTEAPSRWLWASLSGSGGLEGQEKVLTSVTSDPMLWDAQDN